MKPTFVIFIHAVSLDVVLFCRVTPYSVPFVVTVKAISWYRIAFVLPSVLGPEFQLGVGCIATNSSCMRYNRQAWAVYGDGL
jgi:hypothetical protein